MSDVDATEEQVLIQESLRIVRDATASQWITVNSPEDWYGRLVGLEPDLSAEIQWTAWTLARAQTVGPALAQVSLVWLGRLVAAEYQRQTGKAGGLLPGHRVRKALHVLCDRDWLMIPQGRGLGPAPANIYTLNVPEVN